MANWYGSARTNYVRLNDGVTVEALQEHLELIGADLEMWEKEIEGGLHVGFGAGDSDNGGFPCWLSPNIPDREADPEGFARLAKALQVPEDDLEGTDEAEFSWEQHIMPFVAEGEVLVAQEIGAEKLRYLTGHATAFIRRGETIQKVGVSISDIYEEAAETFGVDATKIIEATY